MPPKRTKDAADVAERHQAAVPDSNDVSPPIPTEGTKGKSTSKSRSANQRPPLDLSALTEQDRAAIQLAASEVKEKKAVAAQTKDALKVARTLEVETSAALKQSQTKENREAYEMAQKNSIRINREILLRRAENRVNEEASVLTRNEDSAVGLADSDLTSEDELEAKIVKSQVKPTALSVSNGKDGQDAGFHAPDEEGASTSIPSTSAKPPVPTLLIEPPSLTSSNLELPEASKEVPVQPQPSASKPPSLSEAGNTDTGPSNGKEKKAVAESPQVSHRPEAPEAPAVLLPSNSSSSLDVASDANAGVSGIRNPNADGSSSSSGTPQPEPALASSSRSRKRSLESSDNNDQAAKKTRKTRKLFFDACVFTNKALLSTALAQAQGSRPPRRRGEKDASNRLAYEGMAPLYHLQPNLYTRLVK
ncbi:hypothetical protein MPER_13254 [Moniliophthora perniciosa FA553]|nr:hypothetical protein MPER_13254 [Moniliophthora perniciosa FA553]